MKLKDCFIGKPVMTNDFRVGHIVGFQYNISTESAKEIGHEEMLKQKRVIPTVKWADGSLGGIQPSYLSPLR
jgi:hypothetical protein